LNDLNSFTRENFLQLSIMSSDVVRSSVSKSPEISLFCSASELPKHNFVLIISEHHQDVGSIGTITIDPKRPLIYATANLTPKIYMEFWGLIMRSAPRIPSIYISIHSLSEFFLEINKASHKRQTFRISDVGWRYPIS
jgi:hypothetical protein